jgi:hypothetical protein
MTNEEAEALGRRALAAGWEWSDRQLSLSVLGEVDADGFASTSTSPTSATGRPWACWWGRWWRPTRTPERSASPGATAGA